MKKVFELVLTVVLSIAVLLGIFYVGFVCGKRSHSPTPLTNNTLRWVRDPNLGDLYYGWYEEDGSAFNSVATASRNKRMGETHEKKDVPVYIWSRIN